MTWVCPKCKKVFKNKNQAHSCAIVDLSEHIKNKPPHVKATFDKLIQELNKIGKININPVKTSIQVKATATFLSIQPKKDHIKIEFQLGSEIDEFPIYKTFQISKNRVLHFAILKNPQDVNTKLMSWLEKSYELVNK